MRIERRNVAVWGALAALWVFLLSGCQSSDVDSSSDVVSSVVAAADSTVLVVPAATVAIAADRTGVAVQESSIAVGAPEQLYSEQVTKSDLWRMNMQHGCKFYEPWKYMGTKDRKHYLMIYPFLGFREVYRIAADEYPIEEPFELTARTSTWRNINKFSHHGTEQQFIIEPLWLGSPDAPVSIQLDGFQDNGVGGEIEDLFMQDVQILLGE
ncbi:MAG: hypothetical protein ACI9FZ_001195 [Bacteroidia bacterium]|jgi:hypothetical protein